jgi:hypothetical protein
MPTHEKQWLVGRMLRPPVVLRVHDNDGRAELAPLEHVLGVDVCSDCGRTILLGEKTRHVALEGRSAVVCRDCAARLRPGQLGRAA